MKRIGFKKQKDLAHQKRVRAKLLLECTTDSRGFPLCPQCGKLPDYRGLSLMHIKALSQGGRTSKRNCRLSCYPCHNGPDGHRIENMPKSKPADRPTGIFALSGYHGATGREFSREQQAGIKKKERLVA